MAIPTSLNVGTRMLAMNTTAAIGNMPCLASVTTPDMMVSGVPLPSMRTVMMGSRFAGR